MGPSDLTPYSPRLLLEWEQQDPDATYRGIDGTLVFADVSGFTRLSERLARSRGKAGAEDMVDIIGTLFGDLLTVAAIRGGEMLKYGGDAVLLFFRGEDHARRAAAASVEMQTRLREIGRVQTDAGAIRMRMSVGMNSGSFDLFKVGGSHQELVITGPATTETVRMEAAADAGEILVSASTAAALDPACLGAAKEGGVLLRRPPAASEIPIVRAEGSDLAERFVSVGLRPHLTAGAPEPEHRLATVAFVHAMGVDDPIRSEGPGIVAERLHETVTIVQDAFEAFGVSFLATDLAADGAKVMAASGVPIADDDPERRMLLALRRIVDARTPLPVRAGVHRGHVFAAAVGPGFRQTYTTMGDVTNTAARLCAKAEPGEILALKGVLDHARGGVVHTQRPPFVAKGKSEPLVPYAIEAVVDEDPVRAAAKLPLVGREVELECLLAAADALRAGNGGLVELVGDMGSGKSRLIDELLERVADLDRVVAHCEPYERSTPFHPIRRLLERVLPDDLALTIEQVAPHLRPWVPLIASVLDIDVEPTAESRDLDPKFRLQRTAEATVELLEALVPREIVIVVEDLHWLDAASAMVLRRLETVVATRPWLVVVTRRDEPSAFTASSGARALVHLVALADTDMTQLVAAATADAPLPPHRQAELVGRSGGNPLFLTELLTSTGSLQDADLPDSIEAVMAAQIDRLPAADRRLLRLAAVLGSRCDLELLAEIAGEPELTWADASAVAERLQSLVVADGNGRIRFRHQLIRDVAYEALPFNLRRDLHAQAGEAIERRCALDGRERPGILSLHYFHARRFDACWRYARQAAERASDKHAIHEAVQLLERALTAAKHVEDIPSVDLAETWDDLSARYEFLGDLGRAREALRNARQRAQGIPRLIAMSCRSEARIAQREASNQRMVRWLRRGLTSLDGLDGQGERSVRAELMLQLAWAKQQGKPHQAIAWAERARHEAEQCGERRIVAYADLVLDGAAIALGKPSDLELARRALAIFEDIGELSHQAVVLNTLGARAYYQGRWTEAVAYYQRGRDVYTRIGDVTSAATGTFNIAEILLDQGRLDEAERKLDEVSALWRSVTYELGLASIAVHRGRLAVSRGQIEEAIALFEEARAVFAHYDLGAYALEVEARTADCLLRVGRTEDARSGIEAAIARATSAGEIRTLPLLRRLLGYCAAAAGDIEAGWSAMDESLHVAREIGSPYDVALTLEGFSVLAALGAPPVVPEWEAERRAVLDELGVVVLPTPPLPVAAAGTAPS